MAKSTNEGKMDTYLSSLDGSVIHVCSGEPADYAGIAAVELASQAITGSYVLADGDTNGRKNTCPAQSDLDIDASGTATHVATSSGGNLLEVVTTCTSQTLTIGGTVSLSAWDHELADPV